MGRLAAPDYAPEFGIYADGTPNAIAIVRGENAEANARRISANPELLAVVQSIIGGLGILARFAGDHGLPAENVAEWIEAEKSARAAVTKATQE